jgi:hypothetical protein
MRLNVPFLDLSAASETTILLPHSSEKNIDNQIAYL